MAHRLEGRVDIIWNSSAWEICLSPHSYISFISLTFTLFYTSDCNPVLLSFVIQIISVWPLGALSVCF